MKNWQSRNILSVNSYSIKKNPPSQLLKKKQKQCNKKYQKFLTVHVRETCMKTEVRSLVATGENKKN